MSALPPPALGISESVSEMPRRGRPQGILGLPGYRDAASLYAGKATRRTLQNAAYLCLAINALQADPDPSRFQWLVDFDRSRAGDDGTWRNPAMRRQVLSELGRLEDADAIRIGAAELCKAKPHPATLAVKIIRLVRGSQRASR